MTAATTTLDIASRLVPMDRDARAALLARFPGNRGHVSQLADSFGGSWYVHRGDLAIDGDFSSTLNLVIDGDLTVRGTLWDHAEEALLVVAGDLYCQHLFSRQLLVVLGSLHARGVVCADYNDYAFEVWGDELSARALLLEDKSALLPETRHVEFEYDSDQMQARGDVAILQDGLLRHLDADATPWRREERGGAVVWVDDSGARCDEPGGPASVRQVPEDYDHVFAAVSQGLAVFREQPAPAAGDWRIDRDASPSLVATQAVSAVAGARTAAASHPQLPDALLPELARDADPRVRATVVHHPRLPAAAAALLATDTDADVRRQMAASSHATPHLAALASDTSAAVRRATAAHPALPDDARRRLLADADDAVKRRALRYLPVTAAWVAELRNSQDGLLSAWALEHAGETTTETIDASDWKQGLLDARPAVREAALRVAREGAVLAFLDAHRERFASDPSPALRRALAMAARDGATLTHLCGDPDEYTRRFALANLAVPEACLMTAARSLAAEPSAVWGTSHPRYMEAMTSFQDLHQQARLPPEGVRALHRAFPLLYRLEPHRNMPLDVALERAASLEPSLGFEPEFRAWQDAALAGDVSEVLGVLLGCDNHYLESAARLNGATPATALLAAAQRLSDDTYALEELAWNAALGRADETVAALLRLLVDRHEHGIDRALARNPDVPRAVLLELRERAPDEVRQTLWQVHGELL